ncbi:chorismate mutase [uncultured Brevundimonas sp.]|uniref:chorismate mutase n=1 Tax=uncultured Brevundimonas sp. TaxID=213418 RepID=UPI0030EE76D5
MSTDELAARRARIDRIDTALVRFMAARQREVMQIARLKRDPDGVRDPERIAFILDHIRIAARRYGLDEAVATPVWRELLERSAQAQQSLLRRNVDHRACLDEGQCAAGRPSSRPGGRSPMQGEPAQRNPS